MVQIDVLEKPIERIKDICVMMGIAEKFASRPRDVP